MKLTARELLEQKARDYELRARAADDQAVAGDARQRELALAYAVAELMFLELCDVVDALEREAA